MWSKNSILLPYLQEILSHKTLSLKGDKMNRPWFNRVMWFIAGMLLMAMMLAMMFMLVGCSTFEYTDSTCHIKVTTLGKDIAIDPNGIMSTVSPKNQGIIEAVAGFAAGAAVVGL
jgi:hypothetical protein